MRIRLRLSGSEDHVTSVVPDQREGCDSFFFGIVLFREGGGRVGVRVRASVKCEV